MWYQVFIHIQRSEIKLNVPTTPHKTGKKYYNSCRLRTALPITGRLNARFKDSRDEQSYRHVLLEFQALTAYNCETTTHS